MTPVLPRPPRQLRHAPPRAAVAVDGSVSNRPQLPRLTPVVQRIELILGAPDGYYSHEPGLEEKPVTAPAATRKPVTGIELDGDTCDRDCVRTSVLTVNRTYKLELDYWDGCVDRRRDTASDSCYQERRHDLHSEIEQTEGSLHLGSRHGRLLRTSWLHRQLHPESDRGVAPLGRWSAAARCQRGSLLIAAPPNERQPTPSPRSKAERLGGFPLPPPFHACNSRNPSHRGIGGALISRRTLLTLCLVFCTV